MNLKKEIFTKAWESLTPSQQKWAKRLVILTALPGLACGFISEAINPPENQTINATPTSLSENGSRGMGGVSFDDALATVTAAAVQLQETMDAQGIDLPPAITDMFDVVVRDPEGQSLPPVTLDNIRFQDGDTIMPGMHPIGHPGVYGFHLHEIDYPQYDHTNPSAVPYEGNQEDLSAVKSVEAFLADPSTSGQEAFILPEGGYTLSTLSQVLHNFADGSQLWLPEQGVDHSYIVLLPGSDATGEIDQDSNNVVLATHFTPDAVKVTKYQVAHDAGRLFSIEEIAKTILAAHGASVGTGGGDEGGVSRVTLVIYNPQTREFYKVDHHVTNGWSGYETNVTNFEHITAADFPPVEDIADVQ